MANSNIRAVITAEDRASRVLAKFSNSVERLNDRVVSSAKKAAFALGTAGLAATTFAVKSAADFEQTRIGLENMLGSADKARAMLAKVSKFAAETPFEFPELAQATRQLVAFGFSGEDAFKTMTQLGDVSAAIGAPINDLAYLMGTLRAQGRAFTIDIRQFAMRGIPIYEYLAKVLKTNTKELTKMIEEGKVGFPEVQKAFQMMTAEGGKFHGTMAKQSKSLTGLFSTLKDVIGQTARELVGITQEGDIKEGSLFDRLRRGTAWLIDNLPKLIASIGDFINALRSTVVPQITQWAKVVTNVGRSISEYLSPKLEALWNSISTKLIPALSDFWKNVLVPMIPVIGTALVGALGLALDALNLLIDISAPIISWFSRHKEIVWGLVGAYTALKVALAISGAISAVRGAIALMGSGMKAATLKTLGLKTVLTKMYLPGGTLALFAAGAILTINQVLKKFKAMHEAAQDASSALASLDVSNDMAVRRMQKEAAKARARGDTEGAARIARQIEAVASQRAVGGPVNAGAPYIVGERGPELFVPNNSGSIVPNHKMGGSTVNINITAGAFMGSETEARKYANKILNYLKDSAQAKGMSLSEMMGA